MGSERLPNSLGPKASANAVLIVCFLVKTNKKEEEAFGDSIMCKTLSCCARIMECAKATRQVVEKARGALRVEPFHFGRTSLARLAV